MVPQNLVFIMADEHNVNMLGSYGHPMVKTPNLDRLAAEGTRFTNAYTNCPICVPARGSFATGLYVHQIGCWDYKIHHPDAQRLLCRDHISGQNQPLGASFAYQPGQPLGPTVARDDAQIDLRLS